MKIKSDEVIGEILGMFAGNPNQYNVGGQPTIGDYQQSSYSTPSLNPGFSPTEYQPKDWQERIIRTISGGKDLFIVARPGAGKTLPMVFYWFQECLGMNPMQLFDRDSPKDYLYQAVSAANQNDINKTMAMVEHLKNYRNQLNKNLISNFLKLIMYPETLPKILMLVPVIALANDMYESMTKTLSGLFLQVMDYIDKHVELDEVIVYSSKNSMSALKISRLIDDIVQELGDPNNLLTNNKQAVQTYNYSKNVIIGMTEKDGNLLIDRVFEEIFEIAQLLGPTAIAKLGPQTSVIRNKIREIADFLHTRNNDKSLEMSFIENVQNDILAVIDPSNGISITNAKRKQLRLNYLNINNLYQRGANLSGGNIEQELKNIKVEIDKISQSQKELYANKIKEFIHSKLVGLITGPTKSRAVSNRIFISCIYQSAIDLLGSSDITKQLKAVFCDEAHLIMKFEDDRPSVGDIETQSEQIAKNVYYVVKTISKDTRLVMMTGTLNPKSAKSFAEFMNHCYGRKFEVISDIQDSNKATLNYIPADWLMNDRETINRVLINPRTTHNLLVVFGKNKMLDMLEKTIQLKGNTGVSLAALDRGRGMPYVQKTARFNSKTFGLNTYDPGDDISSKRGDNPQSSKDIYNLINKGGKPTEIFHPIQKKAVESGIGFIFRMDDKIPYYEKKYEEKYYNDFRIVARLFSEGRIPTLLVTDAVGIGVNMDVQNIFLTSSTKPDGRGAFEQIKISNLSQFLNRAGRSTFMYASIYAPEKDIPAVREALAAGITDFEERLVIGNSGFSKALCQSKEMFKMLMTSRK